MVIVPSRSQCVRHPPAGSREALEELSLFSSIGRSPSTLDEKIKNLIPWDRIEPSIESTKCLIFPGMTGTNHWQIVG